MSTGWICPRCNTVMAPHILVCINCSGNQSISPPDHWKLPLKNYPESTHIDLCEHDVLKISGRCPRCVPSPYSENCPHGLFAGCSICGSLKR